MKTLLSILVGLFVVFQYTNIYAKQPSAIPVPDIPVKDPVGEKDDIPFLDKQREKVLNETQEDLTNYLLSAATWFDSFFDDPRHSAEQNKTRAKAKLAMEYSRHDNFEFQPSIDLRLKVPKLEHKLNLLITAKSDEDFETEAKASSGTNVAEKDDLSVSLQYFLHLTEQMNLSTSFGGSYDYLYAGIRYRHLEDFGPWQGRLTERLRYYTDDGWENKLQVDLERHFSAKWFFRAIAGGVIGSEIDGIPHHLILRTYQVLNKEEALLYEVGSYYDTDPSYVLSDLQFKLRYRQRFYRDWMVLELTPYVTFPEDDDHEFNPGFLMKLEFDFGYLADQDEFDTIFRF